MIHSLMNTSSLSHLQDPWYGDILIYLQTLKLPQHLSRDDRRRICHQAKNYLIIDDTLYHRGVDVILHRCLTHEEAEAILNDYHSGACGGHLSGLATTQKILRAGYFWPSIFKDCIEAVKKCHPFQVFTRKMHSHPAPLHPVIIINPFTKWGVDFMDCNPTLAGGTIILSWSWIILLNGLRPCLPLNRW
jgi:hypothetical protein